MLYNSLFGTDALSRCDNWKGHQGKLLHSLIGNFPHGAVQGKLVCELEEAVSGDNYQPEAIENIVSELKTEVDKLIENCKRLKGRKSYIQNQIQTCKSTEHQQDNDAKRLEVANITLPELQEAPERITMKESDEAHKPLSSPDGWGRIGSTNACVLGDSDAKSMSCSALPHHVASMRISEMGGVPHDETVMPCHLTNRAASCMSTTTFRLGDNPHHCRTWPTGSVKRKREQGKVWHRSLQPRLDPQSLIIDLVNDSNESDMEGNSLGSMVVASEEESIGSCLRPHQAHSFGMQTHEGRS